MQLFCTRWRYGYKNLAESEQSSMLAMSYAVRSSK